MKYELIVLDCDGVLADFISSAVIILNRKYNKNIKVDEIVDFDLEKTFDITTKQLWKTIEDTEKFWEKLYRFEWIDDIVDLCRDYADDFVIATSPSTDGECFSQKYKWLRRIRIPHNKIMIGYPKYLLAKEHRLLIDDSPKNIRKFVEYGGDGLLFPCVQNELKNEVTLTRKGVINYITYNLDILTKGYSNIQID